MTKEYEEMSLEELKKLKEEKDKTSLINELETAKQKEKEEADKKVQDEMQKQIDEKVAAQLADYKKLHPESDPELSEDENALLASTGETENGGENKNSLFINGFYDRHKTVRTSTRHVNELKPVSDETVQMTNTFKAAPWSTLFEETESDTGCGDIVDAWSPEDTYSKIIWNTFVCKADLFQVCVKGLAINPGDGLHTQIRVYGALSDPAHYNACSCMSCTSITWSNYTLTLDQYGKQAVLCEEDIWDIGNVMMDSYLNAFSDMWAQWFDNQIYLQVRDNLTPGLTQTSAASLVCASSATGSCCSDSALMAFYDAIQMAVANMREGTNPYDPDYIIISPTVGAILKRLQTPTRVMGYNDTTWSNEGRLKKIGSLKVIEYCRATGCTDAGSATVAVILDSRRAVGAVFGQKPKTYKTFQSNCNSTRIDSWVFFACGELDLNAIAHITNP